MFFRDRLRHLQRTVGALGRRDPTLYLLLFAAYTLVNGMSLILTERSFDKVPQFAVAREWGLNDNWVGSAMVLNGVMLLWSLGDRRSAHIRALVALVTGALWLAWSSIVMAGGFRIGLAATSASNWVVIAAIGLLRIASTPYPDAVKPLRPDGGSDA